jgi:hypothetical protein
MTGAARAMLIRATRLRLTAEMQMARILQQQRAQH